MNYENKYTCCNCFQNNIGTTGPTSSTGPTGAQGIQGLPGPTGATGAQGEAGGILNFADFYALMPPDNAATVAPGTDVSFPHSLIFFMSTIIFTETQKYRRSRTISTNTKQQ